MKKWAIERRRLGDEDDESPWERRRTGDTMQEAAWYYNQLSMYIQCHEQRLLDPEGMVVLHHRDQRDGAPLDLSPPPWRERWRDLLIPE